MNLDLAISLLIVLALILANLPWLMRDRVFLFVSRSDKPFWLGLIEWLVYYALAMALARFVEWRVMGNLSEQGWEFWTTTFFLFAIFSFPGFIFRYNLSRYLQAGR